MSEGCISSGMVLVSVLVSSRDVPDSDLPDTGYLPDPDTGYRIAAG